MGIIIVEAGTAKKEAVYAEVKEVQEKFTASEIDQEIEMNNITISSCQKRIAELQAKKAQAILIKAEPTEEPK